MAPTPDRNRNNRRRATAPALNPVQDGIEKQTRKQRKRSDGIAAESQEARENVNLMSTLGLKQTQRVERLPDATKARTRQLRKSADDNIRAMQGALRDVAMCKIEDNRGSCILCFSEMDA